MNRLVDALGQACPIPVIRTKDALAAAAPHDTVSVLVDNETAVRNLTKLAEQLRLASSSAQEGDRRYRVDIEIGETLPALTAGEPAGCGVSGPTVVQISSDCMGSGSDELGQLLMKSYLFALTQLDTLPDTILFYNGGAKLTVEGSPALDDLKKLEAEGVELLTCGTCLNHFGLTEQLAVGGVTNMYAIAEALSNAGRIVRP